MTAPAFPESILGRAIMQEGFQYSRNESIERTPMDSGLSRGRLFNKNPLAKVPCQFVWSEFQVQLFEAWLQTTANRGATWFTVYLPLEGETYRQVLSRVAEVPPRSAMGGSMMLVPIVFEVHDTLVLPDGIVDLILEFGATGTQEMAAAMADTSLQPYFDEWATVAEAA